MTPHKKEASLYHPVSKYVHRKGFRLQHPEMPFYEYSIDLYGFSRVRHLTVAVELKLTKWKRAFQQAILYQLCSDLVYIAMPAAAIRRVDLCLLEQYGIGLLSVDPTDRCREILGPVRSEVLSRSYKNAFIELVRKGT